MQQFCSRWRLALIPGCSTSNAKYICQAIVPTTSRISTAFYATYQVERTLVAVKPDGVARRLVGEVISTFENRGYKLCAIKIVQATPDQVKQQYPNLVEEKFFPVFTKYMTDGGLVLMVWQGYDVVNQARRMLGVTNPLKASIGTIRGKFSVFSGRNVVHGSDSVESAEREIGIWFTCKDIVDWPDKFAHTYYDPDG